MIVWRRSCGCVACRCIVAVAEHVGLLVHDAASREWNGIQRVGSRRKTLLRLPFD
jgi:hypothetical protein